MVFEEKSEVSLWDLPDNVYVKIANPVRKDLFSRAIEKAEGIPNLARLLSIKSIRNLYAYKNGEYYTPLKIIKKILLLLPDEKIQFEHKVQNNIEKLRATVGFSITNPTFPIKFSPTLARIAGHMVGDGGLFTYKNNITTVGHYTNQSKFLIEQFKKNATEIFGDVKIYAFNDKRKNAVRLTLPTIVGIILKILLGSQVGNSKHVPQTILKANKKSKAAFLGALFDDEGSVNIGKRGSGHSIEITLECKNIIFCIRDLLCEFGIKTGKLREKKSLEHNKIYYVLHITGKHDFEKFNYQIGFNHTQKKGKLERIIKGYSIDRYKRGELEKKIVQFLAENGSMSIYEIARHVNRRPVGRFRKQILSLERIGEIKSHKVQNLKMYSAK